MFWIGEGDEAKTPGSLSLPVLDNDHLRNRAEAAEVIFQSLLISVEIEPSNEELPFFRGHGSELGVLWAEYGEWDKEIGGERKEENYRK